MESCPNTASRSYEDSWALSRAASKCTIYLVFLWISAYECIADQRLRRVHRALWGGTYIKSLLEEPHRPSKLKPQREDTWFQVGRARTSAAPKARGEVSTGQQGFEPDLTLDVSAPSYTGKPVVRNLVHERGFGIRVAWTGAGNGRTSFPPYILRKREPLFVLWKHLWKFMLPQATHEASLPYCKTQTDNGTQKGAMDSVLPLLDLSLVL